MILKVRSQAAMDNWGDRKGRPDLEIDALSIYKHKMDNWGDRKGIDSN